MAKADLTAQRLREVLHYDPHTGSFSWSQTRMSGRTRSMVCATAGETAGWIGKQGYLLISIACVMYRAHRLAWLYMTGEWPTGLIDHHNGERTDNRFHNLRDATDGINAQNIRRATARSKSGFLGVSKVGNRFTARIGIPGAERVKNIGTFASAEEAHSAYVKAKRKLHPGCMI